MLLVVFGHYAKQGASFNLFSETIFIFLYLFHMPCFMFLSGFFAKPDNSIKRFLGFLSLYLVCQVAYQLANIPFSDAAFNPFRPHPGLWYLLVMALCYLILPVLDCIKPPIALLLTVLLGLGAGFIKDINHFMSFSRFFVYLPFFLLGYYATKEHIFRFKRPLFFILSAVLLAGVFVLCFVLIPDIPSKALNLVYSRGPYTALALGKAGALWRALQYVLAFLMSAAFLILIPRKQYVFSVLGKYTIAVYVLHLFCLLLDREFGISVFLIKNFTVLAVIPYSIAITLLFSIPLLSKPFRWLLTADFKGLYRHSSL